MTIEEAALIVSAAYPDAHPVASRLHGHWSICNGTRTEHGPIRIPGVGWHETIEAAWVRAAELVLAREGIR